MGLVEVKRPSGKAIREAVAFWRTALGLDDWNFTVQIGRLPGGDYGSAEVDIPYKKAHLRFWPKGIVDAGDTVDAVVVHEIAHAIVEPLAAHALALAKTPQTREITGDLEEALTTEIERLVLRLHKRPRSD